MSTAAMLITYVWHYLIARLLYDELVRPLAGGDWPLALAMIAAIAGLVLVRRALGQRGPRRPQ
jgi:hypothetical protein